MLLLHYRRRMMDLAVTIPTEKDGEDESTTYAVELATI